MKWLGKAALIGLGLLVATDVVIVVACLNA